MYKITNSCDIKEEPIVHRLKPFHIPLADIKAEQPFVVLFIVRVITMVCAVFDQLRERLLGHIRKRNDLWLDEDLWIVSKPKF